MCESLKKLLPDVFKSLSNFNERHLSTLLHSFDCSDCSNFSDFKNTPFSNALTISLSLRSAIALFITSSFAPFRLGSCGQVLLLNSLICFAKWFFSSFAILILVTLFLLKSLLKARIVLNFPKS